jgi:hypothetical protein
MFVVYSDACPKQMTETDESECTVERVRFHQINELAEIIHEGLVLLDRNEGLMRQQLVAIPWWGRYTMVA